MACASGTPTQMGSTPVPWVSCRTTTGVLVAGSIISPRIFTSSSMVASVRSTDLLADKTERRGASDARLNVFSQKIRTRRTEINDQVARGAPGPLRASGVVGVDHEFEGCADELFVAGDLNPALAVLKNREAIRLHFLADRVRHGFRGSVRARRVGECVYAVVANFVDERQGFLEVRFAFARKSDDDVARDADGAAGGANPGNFLEAFLPRVGAAHRLQDARRSGLDWQVDVVTKLGRRVDRVDNFAIKIVGVGSGKADAADSADGRDFAQHLGKPQVAR